MSRAGVETRQKVLEHAKERMRRRGVAATSMLDVIADAGASRGSIYHYFPGGKAQLIEEATELACSQYASSFTLLESLDAEDGISAMVEYWRTQVESTNYEAGCPIAAAALSAEETPTARVLAGQAFAQFQGSIEQMLRNSDVPPDRAASIASLILTSLEGAVVVGLAQRSMEPMQAAAAEWLATIRAARSKN